MKIHEYNEMMAYLTRPAMAYGGRIGFGKGTKYFGSNAAVKSNLKEYEKLNKFLQNKINKNEVLLDMDLTELGKKAKLNFIGRDGKKISDQYLRDLVSKYVRKNFPKTFVLRNMDYRDMPSRVQNRIIELSKTLTPKKIALQLMDEKLIPKAKSEHLNLTGIKKYMGDLKNEGRIANIIEVVPGGRGTTIAEQSRVDKLIVDFIEKNPTLRNSHTIAKRLQGTGMPEFEKLSTSKVEDALIRQGKEGVLQTRFEKIFPDVKALDKIIKQNKNLVLAKKMPFSKKLSELTNLYSKETGKPLEVAVDEIGTRLTRLGTLYAGTGSERFEPKLYKTIKAPVNYMNSELQKQIIALANSSNKTLNNLDTARLLGLPAKEIKLLKDMQLMMQSFPFKVAGDHTDIKSLMKQDIKNYKKNFTRIEHIKDSLNQYKRIYDNKIRVLSEQAVGASPIEQDRILKQVADFKEKFETSTKYRIGDFNIKDGRVVIDPKTPRIGDFDSPLNRYLQQSMRNFETTISPKLKSIPETKVTKFTNPIDKQYLGANQEEIKKIFEYANKNPKIAKESQVLKALSKVPGKVGKSARLIIAGGAGTVAVSTVANAADGTEAGSILPEAAAGAAFASPFISKASGAAGGPDPLKYLRKGVRKTASSILSPLGAGAIWGATGGVDLESGIDRAGLGAEAAFSKELVKHSDKLTKPIQNQTMRSVVRGVLNAGMPLKWAMRAARIASPIGWLTLGAEGIYQLGKYAIKEHKRVKALSSEERARERAEQEEAAQFYAAEGGRVGFAKGPKDPSKRLFIKSITALAALPIVGRFFKLGKVLERASGYTGPAIQKIKGMPEWFPGLVKKLWNEGEDVTKQVAYGEKQVVKRGTLEGGDDVDLVYQIDTGDVSINVTPNSRSRFGDYQTKSGAYNKEYSLDFKKGLADETTKGKKPPDEFGVTELEGRMDQAAADIDWDINPTTVDDAMSDLTELEAFAKNKSTKQIHKKKGTKPKDVFPDYDPPEPDYYDID